MMSRLLPPEEWHRLEGTLLWPVVKTMHPSSLIMVVERDGDIVGCAAYYQQWHLDGVWIKPGAPAVSVGRRLWHAVRQVASGFDIRSVWAMAMSPRSDKLVQSLGPSFPLNCQHYEINVRGIQ